LASSSDNEAARGRGRGRVLVVVIGDDVLQLHSSGRHVVHLLVVVVVLIVLVAVVIFVVEEDLVLAVRRVVGVSLMVRLGFHERALVGGITVAGH
jgi:hypothetical protein